MKVIHLRCTDMKKMVERLRRRALKENRLDDANDKVIQHRLEVYEKETRPVLDYYPPKNIVKVDATMSQIRVLSDIIKILVPLKEEMDQAREQKAVVTLPASSKPAAAPSEVGAVS
jgi:adenylate kinase